MSGWGQSTKRFSKTNQLSRSSESIQAVCLQITDFCLLGIIFIAPIFFGGRHPLGRSVFVCLTCIASICWALQLSTSKKTYFPGLWATWLSIALLFTCLIQIIPLPPEWLEILSPRNTGLLSVWNNQNHLGEWETLSLYPSSSKTAMVTLVAYVLLFYIFVDRLRSKNDIEYWLRMLVLSAVSMAGFGIIQYLTSNGLFFWFYEVPYTGTFDAAKGSFTCKNHFAHMLILIAPALLAWFVNNACGTSLISHKTSSNRKLIVQFILGISLATVLLAVLLSFSRGGLLTLAIVLLLSVLNFVRRKAISHLFLIGLLLFGMLTLSLLSTSSFEKLIGRLDDFTTSVEDLDREEGRRKIWRANIESIKQGSLFGAGAGTHREIYPVYIDKSLDLEYTHAENGYLQVGTEYGILGISLTLLVLATVFYWCCQAVRHSNNEIDCNLSFAIAFGLLASAIHSLFDFIWFIPTCMSFTVILAACALRMFQINKGNEEPTILNSWAKSKIAVGAACAISLFSAIASTGPAAASLHWDKYLLTTEDYKKDRKNTPPNNHDDLDEQLSKTDTLIHHLKRTVECEPCAARAHLRLAGNYLQKFNLTQQSSDNAMSVDQIREAAIASQFESAQALKEWLHNAFDEDCLLLYLAYHHTRQALQLCPLQGEGYMYLASLTFLEGGNNNTLLKYVAQAQKVRPVHGNVNFEAGRHFLLLGDFNQALKLWKNIYRSPGKHQFKIIHAMCTQVPASLFLDYFEPNWITLNDLWEAYRKSGNPTDLNIILKYATNAARQEATLLEPKKAANNWYLLSNMFSEIQQNENALICIHKAYQLQNSNYSIRRRLGHLNLLNNNYEEAEKHLRWCHARNNSDVYIKRELVLAKKRQMELASSPIQKSYK